MPMYEKQLQSAEQFGKDEFDLHGFHDDRHVMIVRLAATICAGIVSRPDTRLDPAQRQLIADAALDIALKICARLETKKTPQPTTKGG